MVMEINITEMTEDERAVLRLFCKHEGQLISLDCLSERALITPATGGRPAIGELLNSLCTKLRASGYTIRKVETLLRDTDYPEISCEYEEYVFENMGA